MIELIYDNNIIIPFWEKFFESYSQKYRLNDISSFEIDLEKAPDEIVYLNCTGNFVGYPSDNLLHVKIEQYLDYLAIYNCDVINDFNTLNYTYSLVEQYRMFKRFGLSYPLTVFSSEIDELLQMCTKLPQPFQLISNIPSENNKENIFNNTGELKEYLESKKYDINNNDILVARQFISPKENKYHRALIIDNQIIYVYCYDISTGELELIDYIEDLNQLLQKYSNLTTQTGFKFTEIDFIKAKNNAVYTMRIKPAPILNDEIESITDKAGSNALLNLLK